MSLTKHSLGGNYDEIYKKKFLLRESLVSDIPARDGNIEKPFLRCIYVKRVHQSSGVVGHQSSGVVGHQSSGVVGHQSSGVVGHQSSGVVGLGADWSKSC